MKKIVLILMAVLAVAGLNSCQKEGVYKPSHKISKIYRGISGSTNVAKYCSEAWTWDDGLLQTITNYSATGSVSSVSTYTYDDQDRLSTITASNGTTWEFTYVDKKLTTIVSQYKGTLTQQIDVEHDGSKFSKFTTHYYVDSKNTPLSFLKFFLPEESVENLETSMQEVMTASNMKSNNYSIVTELEWDGKNLASVTNTTILGNTNTVKKTTYTYDSKKNPLKKFLQTSYFLPSKNNVLTETDDDETVAYTYEYDSQNYPVKKSWQHSNKAFTTYYEYTE